jgi:hypothetical protein
MWRLCAEMADRAKGRVGSRPVYIARQSGLRVE